MTATKTGGERNRVGLGGYFVEAFSDGEEEADQNRDRRVSMLEAFTYAKSRVVQSYEAKVYHDRARRFLTTTAMGKALTSRNPLSGDAADGLVARTLFFTSGAGRRTNMAFPDDPELQALYQARQELEARVDDLRRIRGGADPDQYQAELETLMIELALKSREIRELETAKGALQDR